MPSLLNTIGFGQNKVELTQGEQRSSPRLESLERRELFSADVSLVAAGGVVDITSEDDRAAIEVTVDQQTYTGAKVVNDGTTSVFLDVALIESVTDLTFSSLNGTATPAAGDFQVGFDITETSDFVFNEDNTFTPIFGTISHTGTVGFNGDSIFVGDFDIIFDASRAVDGNSGFAVVNTIDNVLDNLPLFDIAAPGGLNIGTENLDILNADLKISPEFGAGLVGLGLAGADLTGATVGNAQVNADIASFVSGGTTSVFLDLATLATAANLNLTGVDSDGSPFSGDFQVGFPILETTDFRLDSGGILGGTIKHEGTVQFNDALTVGDFDITALTGRGAGNSGLVVVSTAAGPLNGLILFDVADPGGLAVDSSSLSVTDADLRVSPEFAVVLADPAFAGADLTGAVVGNARVDATLGEVTLDTVTVDGNDWGRYHTTVNGESEASVTVRGFEALNINLGQGSDRVAVKNSTVRGDLNIDTGDGRNKTNLIGVDVLGDLSLEGGEHRDQISLYKTQAASLLASTDSGRDTVRFFASSINGDASIDTGSSNDSVLSLYSKFAGDTQIMLGSGNDNFNSLWSRFSGETSIDGEEGKDRFFSLFDRFDSLDYDGFERKFKI